MKNVKISFSMLIDGDSNAVFVTTGKIVSQQLVFSDSEGNLYRLDINPPRLVISKTGNVVTRLELQAETRTSGTVVTSGMNFPITVKTQHLAFFPDAVEATYDLLDGNTVLSHHALHLQWTYDDEEERN